MLLVPTPILLAPPHLLFGLRASAYSSNSATITIPASIANNDKAILVNFAADQDDSGGEVTPSDVTPSGWTKESTNTGSASGYAGRLSIFSKTLTPADAGATVTGLALNDVTEMQMLVFKPHKSSPTWNKSFQTSVTGTQPSTQTIAIGVRTPPLAIVVAYGGANESPTLSTIPALGLTYDYAGTNALKVGYAIVQSGATHVNQSCREDGSSLLDFLGSGWVEAS